MLPGQRLCKNGEGYRDEWHGSESSPIQVPRSSQGEVGVSEGIKENERGKGVKAQFDNCLRDTGNIGFATGICGAIAHILGFLKICKKDDEGFEEEGDLA